MPNYLLIAGGAPAGRAPLVQAAERRGWFVQTCGTGGELAARIAQMPSGGILVLDTSIVAEPEGIERLAGLADLPALPRLHLISDEIDTSALVAREICVAAGIEVHDTLVRPIPAPIIDQLLGT